MSSRSHDGGGEESEGEKCLPTVGPGGPGYGAYGSRRDEDGRVRVYERGSEEAGAWLASSLVLSRASMR